MDRDHNERIQIGMKPTHDCKYHNQPEIQSENIALG